MVYVAGTAGKFGRGYRSTGPPTLFLMAFRHVTCIRSRPPRGIEGLGCAGCRLATQDSEIFDRAVFEGATPDFSNARAFILLMLIESQPNRPVQPATNRAMPSILTGLLQDFEEDIQASSAYQKGRHCASAISVGDSSRYREFHEGLSWSRSSHPSFGYLYQFSSIKASQIHAGEFHGRGCTFFAGLAASHVPVSFRIDSERITILMPSRVSGSGMPPIVSLLFS